MASSSASSITNSSSYSKPSRFSTTLKVFKFASKEGKSSGPPPPPPLPQKDDFFHKNRSLVSLSPGSLSVPATPLYPHHPQPYLFPPEMNQSSISVVSATPSAASGTAEASSQKGPKKTKSGFFRFPKRSPRANSIKSPPLDSLPPLPTPDDNITAPFNFQHNIHVDEGLMGLPPSWTLSLAQAGFTEEEIAEIHARRAASRSQYIFTDRPASPAYTATDSPIVAQPSPRTSSLSRQVSDRSQTGFIESNQYSPYSPSVSHFGSMCSLPSSARSNPRQASVNESLYHHPQPSIQSRGRSGTQTTEPNSVPAPIALVAPAQPATPSRRIYHVTNDVMSSPPPYTNVTPNGKATGLSFDKKDGTLSEPTPRIHVSSDFANNPSPSDTLPTETESSPTDINANSLCGRRLSLSSGSNDMGDKSDSPKQRLTALPPRLSLHKSIDSTDLFSWGEALLSGISSATSADSSTFAAAQDSRLASMSAGMGNTFPVNGSTLVARSQSLGTTQVSRALRLVPPLKSNALHPAFHPDDEEDAIPLSSVAEPAMTARYDPLAQTWDEPERLSPASIHGSSPIGHSSQVTLRAEPGVLPKDSLSLGKSSALDYDPEGGEERRQARGEGDDDSDEGLLKADETMGQRGTNRDSSRSSTSTVLAEPATIVGGASIARRVGAYVIENPSVKGGVKQGDQGAGRDVSASSSRSVGAVRLIIMDGKPPPSSPLSTHSGNEEGSTSSSGSSTTLAQQTPISDGDGDSPLTYYLDSSPSPDPSTTRFLSSPAYHLKMSKTDDAFGKVQEEVIVGHPEEDDLLSSTSPPRPKIIISDVTSLEPLSALTATSSAATPLTPYQRYPGWLSSVVAPLEQFIDEAIDPREYYLDLHEIAEGESGSVFACRLSTADRDKLKLPLLVKCRDAEDLANDRPTLVAIKSVAILPSGSPKLVDLEKELSLMKGLAHEHVLSMDAVYVDLVEDTLWIRMELMERSLADIVGLVPEGLMLQDRMISRFASDVLLALEFLRKHCIAHRDVRSDNLLLNNQGVLKLTDFSNAVRLTEDPPMRSDGVGVLYWQAPEVRNPPYNALQIDTWSLGATVWEMAEAEPPFASTQQIGDRWPPLSRPQLYSPGLHEFLRLCSQPPSSRPTPSELKKTSFINNACGRSVIIHLLSQCMAIEQSIQEREASQGSVLQ